ncbi:hypothetical protein ACFQ3N_10740 [Virgibacillus byunsanensis]|uniref:YkoP-like domain-containing protein n=1 Tax=Virgibacillus byunsanensis TaxID=570945 RepID=A0ABW3LNG6_9BACI
MKSYLLGVWNAIDPVYYNLTRLHYVPDTEQRNTLFRVRLTTYRGVSVVLSDGTLIKKGDLLIKIHLHNVRMINELQSTTSEVKKAVFIYHMVKRSLPRLANYVESNYGNKNIKGIIGITTLYRGASRLGFEVFPIKNRYYRFFKKSTFIPINLLANTIDDSTPVYLFMSKSNLVKRYTL